MYSQTLLDLNVIRSVCLSVHVHSSKTVHYKCSDKFSHYEAIRKCSENGLEALSTHFKFLGCI